MVNLLVLLVVSCSYISQVCALPKKEDVLCKYGDVTAKFSGKLETETGYTARAYLQNKYVPEDKTFANKTKLDTAFSLKTPTSEVKLAMRSKAMWGSNKILATNYMEIKNVDLVGYKHLHLLTPRFLWLRESWFSIDLTEAFGMDLPKQTFTLGSFPFSLGRGIALGDAYAISPGSLGFFQDYTVDQYAFGAKFSGGLVPSSMIKYDVYAAILENKSTSITETAAQTQAAQFGKQNDPARGFGVINWLFAARLAIDPLAGPDLRLHFEPYALYNSTGEQKLEYPCDSKAKLGTFGLAMEFANQTFEFGFDGALNHGHQEVRGWDRNRIEQINKNGYAAFVYSDIYTVDPNINTVTNNDKVLYDKSLSTQISAINNVPRNPDNNGTLVEGTTLYNSLTRFRRPFTNIFRGYMFVADAGLWVIPKTVRFSLGGGVSSGDINPNANLNDPYTPALDYVYEGFIPLQEVYSGNRIMSVYVLGGGGGTLNRPVQVPNTAGVRFAELIDSFTNLIFAGFSTTINYKMWDHPFNIQSDVITYWSDFAGYKFDMTTGRALTEPASPKLGVEFNLFVDIVLTESLKSSFTGAIFVPGQQYFDIRGEPFTPQQQAVLDQYNNTSIPNDLPLLSNDTSLLASWTLAYIF